MRNWALKKLQKLLKRLAKALIRRYHPLVVGITGSVGKTSTKLATAAVLNSKYKTRMPAGNLNNEVGLPLAIIGDYSSSGLVAEESLQYKVPLRVCQAHLSYYEQQNRSHALKVLVQFH